MDASEEVKDYDEQADNGLNEIYNMDCIEFMHRMKDKCVNLTFTDIPYGELNKVEHGSLRDFNKGAADEVTFNLNKFLREVIRVTSDTIIIFCGHRQYSQIFDVLDKSEKGTTRILVWEKSNTLPMEHQRTYKSALEIAVWHKKSGSAMPGKGKIPLYKGKDESLIEPTVEDFERVLRLLRENADYDYLVRSMRGSSKPHPTTKNLDMLKSVISDCSLENWIIFDPCCGSGNHLLAAKELGRQFVGCELNTEYYTIARKQIGLPPICQALYPQALFESSEKSLAEKIESVVETQAKIKEGELKKEGKKWEEEEWEEWKEKYSDELIEDIEENPFGHFDASFVWELCKDVIRENFIKEFDEFFYIPKEVETVLEKRLGEIEKEIKAHYADPLQMVFEIIDDELQEKKFKELAVKAQALREKMYELYKREGEFEEKQKRANQFQTDSEMSLYDKPKIIEKLEKEVSKLRKQLPEWYFLYYRNSFTRDYIVNERWKDIKPRKIPSKRELE